eukprot:scaffold219504_cov67-Attheya_sp.AAC.1
MITFQHPAIVGGTTSAIPLLKSSRLHHPFLRKEYLMHRQERKLLEPMELDWWAPPQAYDQCGHGHSPFILARLCHPSMCQCIIWVYSNWHDGIAIQIGVDMDDG